MNLKEEMLIRNGYCKRTRKSSYQKELQVRAALTNLVAVVNDNRLDSEDCYKIIGQLAVLGQKLKDERKEK